MPSECGSPAQLTRRSFSGIMAFIISGESFSWAPSREMVEEEAGKVGTHSARGKWFGFCTHSVCVWSSGRNGDGLFGSTCKRSAANIKMVLRVALYVRNERSTCVEESVDPRCLLREQKSYIFISACSAISYSARSVLANYRFALPPVCLLVCAIFLEHSPAHK